MHPTFNKYWKARSTNASAREIIYIFIRFHTCASECKWSNYFRWIKIIKCKYAKPAQSRLQWYVLVRCALITMQKAKMLAKISHTHTHTQRTFFMVLESCGLTLLARHLFVVPIKFYVSIASIAIATQTIIAVVNAKSTKVKKSERKESISISMASTKALRCIFISQT